MVETTVDSGLESCIEHKISQKKKISEEAFDQCYSKIMDTAVYKVH